MARCEYCKKELSDKGNCAYCGGIYSGQVIKPYQEHVLVYGSSWKERCRINLTITTNYMIMRKVPGSERGTAAALGLVGLVINAARETYVKQTFAFYDLRDFKCFIYPYVNSRFKKRNAIKFFMKDNRDFIIDFGSELFAKEWAVTFKTKKMMLYVNGSAADNGDDFCVYPLITADAVGRSVCRSAAAHVEMMKENYIAEPIVSSNEPPSNIIFENYLKQKRAEQQSAASKEFMGMHVAKTYKSTDDMAADFYNTFGSKKPAEGVASEEKQEYKYCNECGNKLLITDKFCVKCGTKQRI